MAIKHAFTSEVEDGADETQVRPSDWNADHEGTATPEPHGNEAHDNPLLLAPAGTAEWENRTYAGWELLTTNTTYTVGSGGDFATLAAAAASLQGLILVGSITLQFLETITLTADIVFKGLISAGGILALDLHGYDLEIDDGCSLGVIFNGLFEAVIYMSTGSSSVKMVADSVAPPYYMVNGYNGCLLNLQSITLNANNKAFTASARLYKSKGRFYICTWSNEGSLTFGGVYATETSHGGFTNNNPAVIKADRGSILVKADGTVVTT